MKLTTSGSTLLLALAAGCASQTSTEAPWQLQPVVALRHAGASPRAYYDLGRYYQGQGRLAAAENAYRQAIEGDGRLADAHSALGTVYAERGELVRAESAIRQAIGIAPDSGYLHNNLGYVLLLQGRDDEAEASLRRALALDPGLKRAVSNLRAIATARSDQVLAEEIRQRWPDDGAVAGRSAAGRIVPMPAFRQESVSREIDAAVASRIDLAAAATPAAPPSARLELSNGNGIAHFARRFGGLLHQEGIAVSRITNQKPFTVASTFVEYQPGHEAAARSLIERIGIAGEPVAARQPRPGSDLRLVFGRDLAERFAPRS